MNIYDFDGTIYDGDSSIDFILYCFKVRKKTLLKIPIIVANAFFYLFKIIDAKKLKSSVFSILKYIDNVDDLLKSFWETHDKNIKDFYRKQHKNTDIIASASPEFLLKPVSEKYNFKLIATKMDKKTGIINGKNCHDVEKVRRLKEIGVNKCNDFYSDSFSDTPVRNIAKKGYIVKKNRIIPWEEYKK